MRTTLLWAVAVTIAAASCGTRQCETPEIEAPDAVWRLTLPVAPLGQRDVEDDPDDRVILEIDAVDGPRYSGVPLTLEALKGRLASAERLYDLKKKRVGKSAYIEANGRRWSRLYIRIEADRDTAWGDVRDLIVFLRQNEFYKIQFAATRSDSSPERVKLQVPLRRDDRPVETVLEIELDGTANYQIGKRPVASLEELGERARDGSPQAGRVLARISAPGSLRFMDVVAVVNQLQNVGVTDYEFSATMNGR